MASLGIMPSTRGQLPLSRKSAPLVLAFAAVKMSSARTCAMVAASPIRPVNCTPSRRPSICRAMMSARVSVAVAAAALAGAGLPFPSPFRAVLRACLAFRRPCARATLAM